VKKIQTEKLIYLERSLLGTIFPLILFFIMAGYLNIFEAWIFFILWFMNIIVNYLILSKYNLDLLINKEQKKQNTKSFDKILLPLYYFTGVYVSLIIISLNIRFNWYGLLDYKFFVAGLISVIISYIFMNCAMISNPFFETTVRIQKDRNQKVISKGLYKIIRHPGYFADFLWYFSVPLIFRSTIAFIPVAFALGFLLIRTYLEDKTLQKELDGYEEYTKKVKYRLIPGVW